MLILWILEKSDFENLKFVSEVSKVDKKKFTHESNSDSSEQFVFVKLIDYLNSIVNWFKKIEY